MILIKRLSIGLKPLMIRRDNEKKEQILDHINRG